MTYKTSRIRGIYYEERYSIRHIEIFKDDRTIRASRKDLERDPMALPDQPIPSVEWINTHEEFCAWEINAQEFEEAWRMAGGNENRSET